MAADCAEHFGDVRGGAVRGGLRGSQMTPEFTAHEQRQAAALGMTCRPWEHVKRRDQATAQLVH